MRRVRLISTTGKSLLIYRIPCQAHKVKIFRLTRRANHFYNSARLTRQGALAIVTNVGWDAVDAAASARKVIAGRVSRERCAARRRTALKPASHGSFVGE